VSRSDFEKLRVYQLAEMMADFIWEVVIKWDRPPRDTVGRQLINAADSIGANIAEGTARGSFADNRRFARIARGSLFEVKHWLRRAFNRKLLSEAEVARLSKLVGELTPKLRPTSNPSGNRTKPSYNLLPTNSRQTTKTTERRQRATDNGQLTRDIPEELWLKI
jgi:four helix bundle protein